MTGDWETTGGGNSGWDRQTSRSRRRPECRFLSAPVSVFFLSLLNHDLVFLHEMQMRHYTDLPVGALSSHCIFPVRNDVGSVVRDDVVVILSIWGKGLGGTGHLGL